MESVGQTLREERLRQLLTLEQVSASTRISVKNLDAIERDELKTISSAFFYRSFVRQFADRLGIDFSTVASAVEQSANSMPRPLIPGEPGTPLPRVSGLRPARKFNLRWVSSVASLVSVLAACSIVYAFWHDGDSVSKISSVEGFLGGIASSLTSGAADAKQSAPPAPAPHSQPATTSRTSSQAVLPRAQAVPPTSAQTAPEPPPVASAQLTPEPRPADTEAGFRIEVSALEKTWLSIVSDGKQIYSGILQVDQSKILESRKSALIRTGNAGGVEVVFNGKQIGPLGPKGQVRTVVFTKDNYEIVQPAERASLSTFTLASFKRIVE